MTDISRGWLAATVLTVATAVAAPPAFAQGGATSPLSGVIVDTSGAVLPGADVAVTNNATGETYNTVSNADGAFTIPALVNGTYSVTVSLMGFKTAVLSAVTVTSATPATVRVALEVGQLAETIVVQGESSAIVQTQSPAITSVLSVNQISNLPLTSRSALDFVINLPGVNTPGGSRDSRVNGLPQGSINITIDGMSVQDNQLKTTDGFFARVSPRLDAVEEVTVSTAAQGAEATATGAVQIRFITRSGTNAFAGRSYYSLRHYGLNANTWFNNRDGLPKAENITYQPGTRVGGPIVIPGLFDGRNRAFFFVNYEEQRTPGQLSRNRNILHPVAQSGVFRYVVGGQTRQVNLLSLAAANGHVSTADPNVSRLLGDIRAATGTTGTVVDQTDPNVQRYTYQVTTKGLTRYPTGRVDVNLTNKHRLFGSVNVTDLLSNPDTLNNSEPTFPGFPGTGFQDSFRYATQVSLRSTLTDNLVNEFRVGGTGGATKFSPNRTSSAWDELDGFHLNLGGACCGTGIVLTNARPGGTNPNYQAREASTKVVENTLNWIKGSHNLQMGLNYVRGDVWIINDMHVPVVNFGVQAGDPADAMFNTINFPGASTTNLNTARGLYALLTGRVSGINGEVRLDETTDEYMYLGPSMQRARLNDYGFYIADTWRWTPTLTVTAGLRYVLQTPFYPLNNSYSTATLEDVFGVSGVGNAFRPGVLTGRPPQFTLFEKGQKTYHTDWNNFAPNVGVAWLPSPQDGLFRRVLGAEGDSVLRAGFSVGYSRPGMSDFTGGIDDNPGLQLSANRSLALGNLGAPGSIFLRNRSQMGPPPFPLTRDYPMTDNVTEDIHIFDPNLQVPWARTWTAGWQRKLTQDTAVEVRYVGTRAGDQWQTYDYNEINISDNGFLDEFRLAQQNLQANIAAGRGATFRYFGAGTGTSPLPIFLAYFSGAPAAQAGNPALYTSTLFANSTFVNPLARFYPQPISSADALDADATRRANAQRAGLPANFLVTNPDLLGGAEVTGNGGGTKYHSLQLDFRKRLSGGLQFGGSYVYGKALLENFYSLRQPFEYTYDTGAEGGVTHAFKANWVYDLPFGLGRKFAGGAGPLLDRLVGGWSFYGIARIQSGRLVDFGNVRLVGMSLKELREAFQLRFDSAGRAVYVLPQDIIDNTVRAFSVSATSPTGYGANGPPTGRYMAPPNGPDCIELTQITAAVAGNTNQNPATSFGECGAREIVVTGPPQIRFDLSVAKRVPIAGRVKAEFRAEMLNAFNRPWFVPVARPDNSATPFTTQDGFRVTALSGETTSRVVQLVLGVTW
ncbi:MAG: carboxypeptidase regulatory-like domain-containing protein [Vicinamibacterales bacterium]